MDQITNTTKPVVFYMIPLAIAMLGLPGCGLSQQQGKEPWTQEQLMPPAALAAILNDKPQDMWPLIIAVNPDGMYELPYEGGIKGSKWFGPTENQENLEALRVFLEHTDRDTHIILYCGCCPFHMCPNIRPAFALLNTMGFRNHKLLDMPRNIRENWINKGYPMKTE